MIKLIASDIDGTLLNSQKQINDDFYLLIKKLNEKNIIFAPTSGRSFKSLSKLFDGVNVDLLYISDNGNFIKYKNKVIYKNIIEKEELIKLRNFIRKLKKCSITYSNMDNIFTDNLFTFLYSKFRGYSKEYITNFNDLDLEIIKCTIISSKNTQEFIYNSLINEFPNFNIVKSSNKTIDITAHGSSKGKALKKIQYLYDIDYDETVVFGDYLNDLDMMDVGYFNYAMENAHPTLKNKARFIAKSNDDNGVVKAIKDLIF